METQTLTRTEAIDYLEENARMVVRTEKAEQIASAFGLGPIPKYLKGQRGDIQFGPRKETGVAIYQLSKWIASKLKVTPTRDGSGFIGRGRSAEADTMGVVEALRAVRV